MKLSVEEASDNFTRFSKRLKNEELRNLLNTWMKGHNE